MDKNPNIDPHPVAALNEEAFRNKAKETLRKKPKLLTQILKHKYVL